MKKLFIFLIVFISLFSNTLQEKLEKEQQRLYLLDKDINNVFKPFEFYFLKKHFEEGVHKEKVLCYKTKDNSYILFKKSYIPGAYKDIDMCFVYNETPDIYTKKLKCYSVDTKLKVYLGFSKKDIIKYFGNRYIESKYKGVNTIRYEVNEDSTKYFQKHPDSFSEYSLKEKIQSFPLVRGIVFFFKKGVVFKYYTYYYLDT